MSRVIRVSQATYDKIMSLGRPGEKFNGIVDRLLDEALQGIAEQTATNGGPDPQVPSGQPA